MVTSPQSTSTAVAVPSATRYTLAPWKAAGCSGRASRTYGGVGLGLAGRDVPGGPPEGYPEGDPLDERPLDEVHERDVTLLGERRRRGRRAGRGVGEARAVGGGPCLEGQEFRFSRRHGAVRA